MPHPKPSIARIPGKPRIRINDATPARRTPSATAGPRRPIPAPPMPNRVIFTDWAAI